MSSFDKSTQAAMEFILTYGWAIVIVLIMVVALAFLGLLNLDFYLPDSCVINSPGLFCRDHSISYERYPAPFSPYKNILRISIINSGGQTVTLKRIKVVGNEFFSGLPYQNLDHDLDNGYTYILELDLQQIPPLTPRNKKVKLEFILEVVNPDTGLLYSHGGIIQGSIN